jgi:uncharacterized membrane protein
MAKTSRLAWIDLLRGMAVTGMIETHVVNTFLSDAFDSSNWLHQLRFYNGLIAPLFFWIAGYMQGMSIRRLQTTNSATMSSARLRRIGLIAFLGYAIHLPLHLWLRGDFSQESWKILLSTDVLQCLAASLLTIMIIGCAGSRAFDAFLLLASVAILVMAPFSIDWRTGFMPLDAWINHDTGSLFPIFPWFAFAMAGALSSRSGVAARVYLPLGALFIAAGYQFAPAAFLYQHPAFFMERLGYLFLITWAVSFISKWFAPQWVQLAGRESLLMYVAHIFFIYALPIPGIPLAQSIGRTLSIPMIVGMFIVLLLTCLGLAWLNEWRKERTRSKTIT